MGLAAFFLGDGGIGLCGLACKRVSFVLERGMGKDGRGVVSVDESVGYLCMIVVVEFIRSELVMAEAKEEG
jgi:hypothetical protein